MRWDCINGHVFDEPVTKRLPEEPWLCCPYCNTTEISEVDDDREES